MRLRSKPRRWCWATRPPYRRNDPCPPARGRERSGGAHRRVADIGIRPPLGGETAVRAVPGQEGRVAAERPQFLCDRIEQLLVIAAREIGATDRTLEQHVADDRELRGAVVKHDMPGRVPRAMDDVDRQIADANGVADRKSTRLNSSHMSIS